MSYLLLIVEPVGQREERGLEGGKDAYARMQQCAQGLQQRGVLQAVQSLATRAARLQVRGGQTAVVDFVIACANRGTGLVQEAIQIARGIDVFDVAQCSDRSTRTGAHCAAGEVDIGGLVVVGRLDQDPVGVLRADRGGAPAAGV